MIGVLLPIAPCGRSSKPTGLQQSSMFSRNRPGLRILGSGVRISPGAPIDFSKLRHSRAPSCGRRACLRPCFRLPLLPSANRDYVPDIRLTPSAAQDFALIVHELAINALKHGALFLPAGRVSLTGEETGRKPFLVWEERGGTPVVTPVRRGIGHTILIHVAESLSRSSASTLPPASATGCRLNSLASVRLSISPPTPGPEPNAGASFGVRPPAFGLGRLPAASP
jgi:hypothetical protein